MSLNDIANRVLDRCDSTNDLARSLGEAGFPHGTWVSTRIQESGRGRLGRTWKSLEGNLFISILVRLDQKEAWTWIPLAAAVGVAQVLRENEWSPNRTLDVRIKWPNDLRIGSAKLGGILCEAVPNRSMPFVIIGIGLNCVSAPQGLDQEATSLTEALGGATVTADDLRIPIVTSVLESIQKLALQGSGTIAEIYEGWSATPHGTKIEWFSESSSLDATFESGIVQGLGPSGELIVKNEKNQTQSLFAEDVKTKVG